MRKRKAILGTRSLEDCCRAFKSPQFLIQSMRLKAACTYGSIFQLCKHVTRAETCPWLETCSSIAPVIASVPPKDRMQSRRIFTDLLPLVMFASANQIIIGAALR